MGLELLRGARHGVLTVEVDCRIVASLDRFTHTQALQTFLSTLH